MLKQALVGMLQGIPATVSRAHVEAVVKAYLGSFATKDMTARLALFAEGAQADDPVGLPTHVGKDALAAFWTPSDEGPAQFSSALHRVIVCGDEAMVHFTVTMVMPGMGEAAIEGFETLAFDAAGKITRLRAFWDESCLT
ncbi:hypothetical protein D3874_18980 [Oleomonas cavernae]|uniref:SnoaL-like domain-containing protein n=1 Tax=Oleomonas cavernae TaxID=2320859 RepID=A0A418WFL5_9PROT|nr:nuclear transport factor 2 family protein [Oleomonas cavernae]RJF88811.1 hypothetical protein D3874_18980 [Oleomonas cavernae]